MFDYRFCARVDILNYEYFEKYCIFSQLTGHGGVLFLLVGRLVTYTNHFYLTVSQLSCLIWKTKTFTDAGITV